jgi:hypothetical protein
MSFMPYCTPTEQAAAVTMSASKAPNARAGAST